MFKKSWPNFYSNLLQLLGQTVWSWHPMFDWRKSVNNFSRVADSDPDPGLVGTVSDLVFDSDPDPVASKGQIWISSEHRNPLKYIAFESFFTPKSFEQSYRSKIWFNHFNNFYMVHTLVGSSECARNCSNLCYSIC